MVCGEAWHTLSLSLFFSLLPLLFPFLFLSLIFLFLFLLALALALSLLSSLLTTKHFFKNRSTNTAANIEAFECDLAQGKCTAVGSPPSSLLLSFQRTKKKEGPFYYRNISGEEFIFFITVLNKFQKLAAGENYSHYSFILIPKQ